MTAQDYALTAAQFRHPHWGIWISSAGRYWATRRGNVHLPEKVHPGWAMTVDGDTLAELERRIQAQLEYEQAPVQFPDYSEDLARNSGME